MSTKRQTPKSDNMLLGSGSLFFDRYLNGAYLGERHLGHADSVNLSTTIERVEKYNKMVASRQKYASVIRETSATVKIALNEFVAENLALALNGLVSIYEQKYAIITEQLFTAYQGQYIDLGKLKVSDVVVAPASPITKAIAAAAAIGTITSDGTVTTAGTYTGTVPIEYYIQVAHACTAAGTIAGAKFIWKKGLYGAWSDPIEATGSAQALDNGVTVALAVAAAQDFVVGDQWKFVATPAYTTFVATTDYIVDANTGRILIVADGGIVDGSSIKVSAIANAFTAPRVSAGKDANVVGRLRFVADNASGPNYYMEAWNCSMTADGDIGLISDDFAAFNLTADCLSDATNHPDDPYYRLTEI